MISALIKTSYNWQTFDVCHLHRNERVLRQISNLSAEERKPYEDFADFVLKVGDISTTNEEEKVVIPTNLIMDSREKTVKEFVHWCYPELGNPLPHKLAPYTGQPEFTDRAILTPKNSDADQINKVAIESFNQLEEAVHLYRADSIDGEGQSQQDIFTSADITVEYLNSIDIVGLPPHELVLKPGVPLMMLRNLDTVNGICNGTKLIFERMRGWLPSLSEATGTMKKFSYLELN
jgi:ATP-dependent DNA helicase PIF1